MTVGELLELEVIQRSGPTYIGTPGQLERPVQWVHPTEIPDIAQFLSGGEAVLTSGLGFGKDAHLQREYVRSLARAKVAVLVVEVAGRTFGRLPDAVRDEAKKVGLPIICAATEFPFAAVTSQVHRRIVNSQMAALETVERASRDFGELLAADADPVQIVQHLATIARCAVVLETAGGEIRGYAGGTDLTDELLTDWRRHWTAEHPDDESHACQMAPVLLRGRVWGYLHALVTHESPDITRYVVDRAATFMSIALLNERVDRARRTVRQTALLSRLMSGSTPPTAFIKDALAMGVDLRKGPYVVLALQGAHHSASARDAPQGAGLPLGESTAARLGRAGLQVLVSEDAQADTVVAALPTPDSIDLVRREARDSKLTAGLSDVVASVADVPAAMVEAQQAMAVAGVIRPGEVMETSELGLFGLLVDMTDRPVLRKFVERELKSLVDGTHPQLSATLTAYARSGFNKAASAQELHIQRRTLYYRLEKIAALLEVDLDSPEVQMRLSVAIAGAQLLRIG